MDDLIQAHQQQGKYNCLRPELCQKGENNLKCFCKSLITIF